MCAAPLVDRYGRQVTDLRMSVTKRCNLRCVYCHDEGQGPVEAPGAPADDEMSADHIERLVRVAREFDIHSVKLTGGEPLLREDIVEIVRRVARHADDVSMTTNGVFLARSAGPLRAAGLRRINVSIDSLHPREFRNLRGGNLRPVLAGVKAALEAGLVPVKINMVVMRQTLESLPAMLRHVGETDGLVLQLIQFMPELVGHRDWVVDIEEVKRTLAASATEVEVRSMHHRNVYRVHGARVEVVDPVGNAEFCFNCRRVRVTHDGHLKGCLNRSDDLVPTAGMDDAGIRDAFQRVVAARVPYYGVHVQPRESSTKRNDEKCQSSRPSPSSVT